METSTDDSDIFTDIEQKMLVESLMILGQMSDVLFGKPMFNGIDDIVSELEQTADWRTRVQERYPDDDRNERAHDMCLGLAADIKKMDAANPVILAINALATVGEQLAGKDLDENPDWEDRTHDWLETRSDFFRSIGFTEKYRNGEEFLPSYFEILSAYCKKLADAFSPPQT